MVSEAFRGEFYQKVDSKARVSVPAAFRRIIEAGVLPDPEDATDEVEQFREFLDTVTPQDFQ